MHASVVRPFAVSRLGGILRCGRVILFGALVVGSLTSCADEPESTSIAPAAEASTARATTDSPSADPPVGPQIDWENPYHGAGEKYASVEDAQSQVWFEIVVPSFGKPDLIQVTPVDTPKELTSVAMVFHLPQGGTVLVEEMPAVGDDSEGLRAIAAAHEGELADVPAGDLSPATEAAYSIVSLRGTEALLVQGQGLGRVMWVEAGVRVDLLGPNLTASEAIELAKSL